MVRDDDLTLDSLQQFAVFDAQAHGPCDFDILDEEPEEQVHEAARNHVESLFGKTREHMEQGKQRRSENQAADSEDRKRG